VLKWRKDAGEFLATVETLQSAFQSRAIGGRAFVRFSPVALLFNPVQIGVGEKARTQNDLFANHNRAQVAGGDHRKFKAFVNCDRAIIGK